MRRPINSPYTITTEFGVPDTNAKFGKHSGIDYAGFGAGRPIYAPASGSLTNVVSPTGGNMVVIYDGKYYHRLMHNSSFSRSNGAVNEGDEVGKAGTTGLSTGVHCHWDINTQGTYPTSFSAFVDPSVLLNQGGDMPSTVGDVEIDQMSWAYFGYGSPSNSDFTKEHRGKESNTFERFMFNHPAAQAYRKQVAEWRNAAGSSGEYSPVSETLYRKKG